MKVLWLTNDPLPNYAATLGMPNAVSGGWLTALSEAIVGAGKIELGVASRIRPERSAHVFLNGVQHFSVSAPAKGFALLHPTVEMLRRYKEIVETFSPDVIHVHGTEWYGGMVTAQNRMLCPTVISLQGLIDHHQRHLLGGLSFVDVLRSRTIREWILWSGLWKQQAQWRKRAVVEREIIQGHQAYIGRTLWDRAHLRRLNPSATYFHCHEMVRREFFEREWHLSSVERHTIFAPSASYPLKGFHVLLRAVAILRHEFPDVKVSVPLAGFDRAKGSQRMVDRFKVDGYSNYLAALIDTLGIADYVQALGELSAEQMAEAMRVSHVFAITSFVENSPNTLAEALVPR